MACAIAAALSPQVDPPGGLYWLQQGQQGGVPGWVRGCSNAGSSSSSGDGLPDSCRAAIRLLCNPALEAELEVAGEVARILMQVGGRWQ